MLMSLSRDSHFVLCAGRASTIASVKHAHNWQSSKRTRETVHCTHAGLGCAGDRKGDLAFRLPTRCRRERQSIPRASLMDGTLGVPSTEHHTGTYQCWDPDQERGYK